MRLGRFFRCLFVLAAFCSVAGVARWAHAATITIQGTVGRKVGFRTSTGGSTNYWISRADCLQDDVLSFTTLIADGASATLEVWAGLGSTDCTQSLARTPEATATCLRVAVVGTGPTVRTVNVRAQDIAALQQQKRGLNGQGVGTLASCDRTSGSAADSVGLFFLLIQNSVDLVGNVRWDTKLDLLGPNPPNNVRPSIGSKLVRLDWDPIVDTDLTGYAFFCDPPVGAAVTDGGSGAGGTGGSGGAGGSGGSAGSGGASGADDAGDAGDDDGGDAEAEGAVTSDAAPAAPNCGGPAFGPGSPPSLSVMTNFSCGSTTAPADNFKLAGLENARPVAVTMGSTDILGNVGPLSPVMCATPEFVNGFPELYGEAGGTAGGGFCSMSPASLATAGPRGLGRFRPDSHDLGRASSSTIAEVTAFFDRESTQ